MTDTDPAIKTARRVFEVLEYFESVQRPISLKEIATRYDYPTSSAAALLKSMVTLGYLFYDSYNRTYMPTMRIAQMGSWLNSGLFGETEILAMVDFVHGELDELVNISTQSDLNAQYIHCLQTSKRLRFEVQPGDIRPLAISGIGRTMLSTHTDVEIARLMRRINALCPPSEQMDLEELMKIINGIRRDGYMFSKHIITPDAGVIAMPLPKRGFGRVLVLGVGGPVFRLEENQESILSCMREGIRRYLSA
ncbi:transcriptional regulator, IclR family [Mesorhizobium australicum]|uniref:Transcriptional regulator, IclR family n=2 Tax=Mesorhizobium australicum TaxID=536018 RepID=A0A1X7MS29_9HYPH|nr:helix-turn-helix domain-containing protein [Mesorhizobium australicum]SMH27649.1 transcriptional regulator, IclR family [Mesorhizobium australicum]